MSSTLRRTGHAFRDDRRKQTIRVRATARGDTLFHSKNPRLVTSNLYFEIHKARDWSMRVIQANRPQTEDLDPRIQSQCGSAKLFASSILRTSPCASIFCVDSAIPKSRKSKKTNILAYEVCFKKNNPDRPATAAAVRHSRILHMDSAELRAAECVMTRCERKERRGRAFWSLANRPRKNGKGTASAVPLIAEMTRASAPEVRFSRPLVN